MKEMNSIERFGDRLIELFHPVGLFVIGGTIVWSAIHEYIDIMSKSHAGLDDILLLFIYLELGAMTAVTRYLAIDLKEPGVLEITTLAGCILVLSISVLVLRYSEKRFVMGVMHNRPKHSDKRRGG